MSFINFKGSPVALNGDSPREGSLAPNFQFVVSDLSESNLYSFSDKYKIIMAVPSLDTGICQIQTRIFNKKLSDKSNIAGIVISLDLPFAMKRFCEVESLNNIISASDFRYHEFFNKYKIGMTDGPLKGLLARAVFLLDQENKIIYREIVPELTQEPNYENVLEALQNSQNL